MKESTKKKTTVSKTTAPSKAVKTESSESSTTTLLLVVILILGVIQLLLTLTMIGGGNSGISSEAEEKIDRLDNFFASNAPGYGSEPSAAAPSAPGQAAAPSAPQVGEPDIENRPTLGSADAPVTIVEYSDFSCGFCGRFHAETYPQLKEEYIDTGLVKFVYKDFPVVGGEAAAIASKCVFRDLGNEAFFSYHDTIFDNQRSTTPSTLKSWALDLGYDEAQYDACLEDPEIASQVQADFAEGQSFGVTGTPAFVINGQLLVGAQPFSAFQSVIDAELAN